MRTTTVIRGGEWLASVPTHYELFHVLGFKMPAYGHTAHLMKFDEETKRMYLAYYYPFSSPEMVQENTGFEIDVSRAELMEGPSPEIIRLIREEIDPGQAFIKVPKDK